MSEPQVVYHLPTLARVLQFTEDNIPAIREWLTTLLGAENDRWSITPVPCPECHATVSQHITLATDEGDREADLGHWIVQDPDGGLHLISPHLMPRLYNLEGGL